jgi:hypothetical protein
MIATTCRLASAPKLETATVKKNRTKVVVDEAWVTIRSETGE